MQKILVVEDDIEIQELLQDFLCDAGYEISVADDGVEAIAMFNDDVYDLVLLDIMLPKIDGYGICELIRKSSQVPVIMVSALDDEVDQIRGLDMQIDDYVTKPFSMPILLRKIAAVLRRANSNSMAVRIIQYKDLRLDIDGYKVYKNDMDVELTHREFELLLELLQNQGKVLTRKVLLNKLWKYDYFGEERVVDTHIKNIRKKLDIDFIYTVRGVGYRIDK